MNEKELLNSSIKTSRESKIGSSFSSDNSFDEAFSYLISGRPYKSLNTYARAVDLSLDTVEIKKALLAVSETEKSNKKDKNIKFEWVKSFLIAAIYAKQIFREEDTTKSQKPIHNLSLTSKTKYYNLLKDKVIIVAGGCSNKVEETIQGYKNTITNGLAKFSGIIFSGGTKNGISGLVGDLVLSKGCNVVKIAYRPEFIPKGITYHNAYRLKKIKSKGFGALEPIQTWIDLFSVGRKPSEIKLVGINGGKISGFEYRMALAFGAKVGILNGSGRAADEIFVDKNWKDNKNLISLSNDPSSIQHFLENTD
jgi:hypothetical protein